MGIPAALDWATVLTSIEELLSNGLVVAAVAASLAISFAPRIIRALRKAASSR